MWKIISTKNTNTFFILANFGFAIHMKEFSAKNTNTFFNLASYGFADQLFFVLAD